MNYIDFSDSETSLYGIASLADSPSENAPDNNVGDFKILRLGTNNRKYNTLMLSSPRFDSLYIGRFWDGNWQGWKKLGREIKYKDFNVELSESNWTTSAAGLNYFNFPVDIPNKEIVISTEILRWSNAKSNVTCSFYDNSYLQFRSSDKTAWNGTVRVFYE